MRNVKMQCNDVNKIKKTKKITGSFSLACVVCVHLFLYLPGSSFFCHSPLIFFLLSFVKLLSSYYLNIKILIQWVRACIWWGSLYNFYNIMMIYCSYEFIEISNTHQNSYVFFEIIHQRYYFLNIISLWLLQYHFTVFEFSVSFFFILFYFDSRIFQFFSICICFNLL